MNKFALQEKNNQNACRKITPILTACLYHGTESQKMCPDSQKSGSNQKTHQSIFADDSCSVGKTRFINLYCKMTFKDQTVLITGGCSGIGRAAAFQFAKEGAKIFLADLSEKAGDDLVEELEKAGTEAAFARIDVTDAEDVERMRDECLRRFGDIQVLVNSAGILGPRARTERYPTDDFRKILEVNVLGLFHCMQAVLPHFLSKKSGNIVNVASVAGLGGFAGHIGYSAGKHAVVGMTRTAALEFAKHGIRINAVCPAFTLTPMLETAIVNDETNYLESLQNAIPMKRFGKPEEIADAIVYLASSASSFMTGHMLVLDGGLTTA